MGRVETPIFSGTELEPHSLLLRTVNTIPGTFAAVAASRVVSVDETAKSIRLDGTRDELFGDALAAAKRRNEPGGNGTTEPVRLRSSARRSSSRGGPAQAAFKA